MANSNSSNQKMSQLFLQSAYVVVNKKEIEIPRSMITVATYIEIINVRAPVMRLTIRDVTNHVTNEIGLKAESRVIVRMGGGLSQHGEIWAETMVAISTPYSADVLTLTLVPEALFTLCQPAGKPQFFNDVTPLTIMRALLPSGVKMLPDAF